MGLMLERTGVDTERELHTIRLDGAYVGSICCSAKTDRFGVEKAGYWCDVVKRPELTKSQLKAIDSYIKRETRRFNILMFGGQK